MFRSLCDKYIKTALGTFKVSTRTGDVLLVFLNGNGPYDTAQIFDPIIRKLPNKVGILAIDYLDSGLSSHSLRPFTLPEEAKLIAKIIQSQQAKQVILVVHSLGGFYALVIAQNIQNLMGFIGIEPTTKEILLNPPDNAAYNRDIKEDAEITEEEINHLMYERIYKSFTKDLADKIWTVGTECEKNSKNFTKPHGLDLSLNILNADSFSSLKLKESIAVILIIRDYRVKEYERSEYYTEKTTIVTLGNNHYIHLEFPDQINVAIQNLLKEIQPYS
ncbi:alpha/beta hydrolase [Weissella sagaensis]|uniref:alpha/beta hydrolase n=1 Tax=Weissella sagaensis TaxID=2559928 RepID=UPI00214B355B|nr:alpha/beta hydrolase [Weissella sagaensis]